MNEDKCMSALAKFNEIASGWKRIISLFGLLATVITLALITDDMSGLAQVITAIGVAFGGFGAIASIAKHVSKDKKE